MIATELDPELAALVRECAADEFSLRQPPSPLDILSADEVAAMLKLDRKSVYAGARAGEIPCRIVGRRFVFVRGAIESWLLGKAPGC